MITEGFKLWHRVYRHRRGVSASDHDLAEYRHAQLTLNKIIYALEHNGPLRDKIIGRLKEIQK